MVLSTTSRLAAGLIRFGAVSACVLVLSGCKHRHTASTADSVDPPVMAMAAPRAASVGVARFVGLSAARKAGRSDIAYDHTLMMTVPAARVSTHFTQLRDLCLGMEGCALVSANMETEERGPGEFTHEARISARLPHDRIEAFLKAASAILPGERLDDVVTSNANTNERDLHGSVTDVERGLAQLTTYRDRLEALESQSAGRTDDLIKIARELSEAQTALEFAQQEKADLSRQIDTEEVTVTYQSAREVVSPLRQSLRQTRQLFIETLADLWVFLVQAIVWAPLVLVSLVLLRGAWRRGWFSRS
ncbi:DUF4349 domain-containing protein [Asaia krungthepensis]|uniref:DUF4349 domain-containing protein n=1 Tax=Asaia krungthepensis NRIC 0535 TaxID=1307925 RepID=A0ABQ0Q626_9PROT|nr:DUF4349 domain-containing protein [Asaia krungthepensis]GBQ93027.1 hypothetical protein AA0535_2718 [Asaia krungthepensis NRIC 0535]